MSDTSLPAENSSAVFRAMTLYHYWDGPVSFTAEKVDEDSSVVWWIHMDLDSSLSDKRTFSAWQLPPTGEEPISVTEEDIDWDDLQV